MAMQLFKRKKKRESAIHYAYCNTFNLNDEFDKTVIQDMCVAHSVFDGGFDIDPIQHAFNAGERNVVLRILTILGLSPEEIIGLSEED